MTNVFLPKNICTMAISHILHHRRIGIQRLRSMDTSIIPGRLWQGSSATRNDVAQNNCPETAAANRRLNRMRKDESSPSTSRYPESKYSGKKVPDVHCCVQ
ncbi:conserved hypothetical protein [Trichinella spiralis]|uniref:hypothetical protein n=1 Tax=Trichinella spiralis TaxID=6334 RepID=UPI0001EFDA3F|nr:conserved hypothetical protein [Trichinella spiralis]